MLSPIKTLFTYFPLTFFLRVLFLLAIDVAVAVVMYRRYKKNIATKRKALSVVALVFCITFVLFLALFGRRSLDYYRFGQGVLSYYTALFNGGVVDIKELVLNILIFVPIGVFGYFCVDRLKVLFGTMVGFGVSVFIELFQFLLRSGYTSVVDVIHNTVGALLGSLLCAIVVLCFKGCRRYIRSKVEKE